MAIIGFLLVFIIPLLFLYSLFKPTEFKIRTKKNKDGKWTRIQSFAAFSIAWLVAVIILVQGVQPDDEQIKDNVVAVSSDDKKPIVKELSRKERKIAEDAAKEAELVKDDVLRISTMSNNTSRPILPNGWSRTDLYVNCQLVLEKQLKSPKSFKSERSTVAFIREAEEKIIGVNFDFYAINSFGAELIHNGTCMYNFDGELMDSAAKAK